MKSTFTFFVFFALSVTFAISALAAIPVRQAAGEKREVYLDSGVFVGGRDHGAQSLLNVRHSLQLGKTERLVLDVGTGKDQTEVGRPGFFHIAVQKNPRRIVIDLQSVWTSKVTAVQVSRVLQKSPFFSKAEFVFDPVDKDLTIELPLKIPAEVEVFELVSTGKPGRIVVDVKPL